MQKVAIITAASAGIGRACAIELHERGYALALMARGEEVVALAQELGAICLQGDISKADDLKKLVSLTKEHYKRVDVLVNNAGYIPKGDLMELSLQNWHDGLDLVIGSVDTLLKELTPLFESQNGGSIVNISTFAAYEPSHIFPISACMRAALGSYIKLYADRYAKTNIRINNVLPGFVDSKPVQEDRLAQIPMGRYAKTEEIAKSVAFLAGDDASYITGQNIRVDGSLTRSV